MANFFSKLKRVFIEPKVYSVMFESEQGNKHLHVAVGYSLEDIYAQFMVQATKDERKLNWSPKLWMIKTFDQLDKEFNSMQDDKEENPMFDGDIAATPRPVTITPTSEKPSKNEPTEDKKKIIQKILNKRDKKLLEANKEILTETEFKYLEARLNEK